MSAARTPDLTRLDNIAWSVFSRAGIRWSDLFGTDSVYDEVLAEVRRRSYTYFTLSLLGEAGEVFGTQQFQRWISRGCNPREVMERLAVYAIVRRLQMLVRITPRHTPFRVDDWHFLGRAARNLTVMPLTELELALPDARDLVVDLYGRADGEFVMVRAHQRADRTVHARDPHGHDAHVTEAFRRLGLERPYVQQDATG